MNVKFLYLFLIAFFIYSCKSNNSAKTKDYKISFDSSADEMTGIVRARGEYAQNGNTVTVTVKKGGIILNSALPGYHTFDQKVKAVSLVLGYNVEGSITAWNTKNESNSITIDQPLNSSATIDLKELIFNIDIDKKLNLEKHWLIMKVDLEDGNSFFAHDKTAFN